MTKSIRTQLLAQHNRPSFFVFADNIEFEFFIPYIIVRCTKDHWGSGWKKDEGHVWATNWKKSSVFYWWYEHAASWWVCFPFNCTFQFEVLLNFLPSSYGTQQPIALLKLLFERGGMYDRDKDLIWKKFKDLTFYSAMGCAGGGRNEVDPRFISMYSVFNLIFPNDESLAHIYSAIFKGHCIKGGFKEDLLKICDMIVEMTLNLFKVGCILYQILLWFRTVQKLFMWDYKDLFVSSVRFEICCPLKVYLMYCWKWWIFALLAINPYKRLL